MFEEFLDDVIAALVVDQVLQLAFDLQEDKRDLRVNRDVDVLLDHA